ncbi:hypothetical protein BEH70_15575 [Citrobacter freundii]|uniref:hypothetical protein n=1 Tax=Citrobacter sp. Cf101 TaxID=2985062 RepID=UPI0008FCE3B2|nr:hypothetical protein [Citrobacter sp. Cf101]ELK7473459.1 hypothetical protein [Citrobacter freundii]MDM3189156.1 hypothetical protein [Citrobacter sp. Cf101]OIZ44020.1 hypothetical protein BEH70_15575 [Citrobacter freundii]
MAYVYESPCEKGYMKIPVSRRNHNSMLPNRKQKIGAVVEYYYHPGINALEAQYFCSLWMKVVLILVMFIPAIVMQGLPETIKDVADLIHERKRGKFSADNWHLNHQKTTDGKLEGYIKKAMESANVPANSTGSDIR